MRSEKLILSVSDVVNSKFIQQMEVQAKNSVSQHRIVETVNQPIDIVFKNLSYTIKIKDEKSRLWKRLPDIKKEILKGISGIIEHGKVTAIMGASGAGKTSLLNIMACRINKSRKIKIEGDLFINMKPYNYDTFGDFANYVMQNDILMQTLTVRETLEFAASLKLNINKEARNAKIMKLVSDLKLEKCIDVLVGGNDVKGISGGEKKRTSIAFQLISDPQVIFLDEPTSGLDSLTAYVIVWYMKKLASNQNKTIAMTIHQPSSQIFGLFDNLILLVAGRLVYQGPAIQSPNYFANIGFKTPQFSNPPDYFMSIMHHDSKVNVDNYPLYFESYTKTIAPKVQQKIENSERGPWQRRKIETSFCRILLTLLWRDAINIRRNPILLQSRIIQTIILALITGALFWKLHSNYDTPQQLSKSFNSKNGAMFFLSISCFMSAMSPVILTFPIQKAVFLKEQSSKLYGVVPYFISRNLIELPIQFIVPFLNSVIVFWMIDFKSSAGRFFMFFFISFLCGLAGNSFGLLVGSFFSDAKVASGILPLIVLPLMLFSGFYKNRKDLPRWIGWVEYISPIKYAFAAYAKNQYDKTNAPIYLLNFDVGKWLCMGLLMVLSGVTRLMSLAILWLLKTKLQ